MGVVDVKVSSGQLEVSKEKNLLVWVLGKCYAPDNPRFKKKNHFHCSCIFKKKSKGWPFSSQ